LIPGEVFSAAAMVDMGMGHGVGMDSHAMARDMRDRFWIALLLALPVLLLSPWLD
jgi:hypothetical protein